MEGSRSFDRWQASRLRSDRDPRSLESVHAYVILDNTGFSEFSAHFPHIFRTFPRFSHIFRTLSEKKLSFPHTVLKFWYKYRFVLRVTELTIGFTFEPPPPFGGFTFLPFTIRSYVRVAPPAIPALYGAFRPRVVTKFSNFFVVAVKNTFPHYQILGRGRGKKDISKQRFFKSGKWGFTRECSLHFDFTRGTCFLQLDP